MVDCTVIGMLFLLSNLSGIYYMLFDPLLPLDTERCWDTRLITLLVLWPFTGCLVGLDSLIGLGFDARDDEVFNGAYACARVKF